MKALGVLVGMVFYFNLTFGQSDLKTDTLTNESIADKFYLYSKAHSSTLLFLHSDKTIYTNNETIWFSAYLISKNNDELDAHSILSVALIKKTDRAVYTQSKYLLESGSGAGSLLLPDSIETGVYQLLAYTNMVDGNLQPIAVFRQEIIIKNLNQHSKDVALKIADSKVRDDSIYTTPPLSNNIITVHINNSIINDTLRFSVSSLQTRQVKILVHNYRQAYAFFTLDVQDKEQNVTIAVNKIPKGVASLSVMDNTGRLLNEQLFFAHYNDRISTSIQTDKTEYSHREKVTVKLRLVDKNGAPVQCMVSVACVQSSRVEDYTKQDIETSVYFNELEGLLVPEQSNRFSDKAYVENELQTKDFHRRKWEDILNVSPHDTLRNDHSLVFSGIVTNLSGPVTKSSTLTVVSDSSLKIVSTDNSGRFNLMREDLTVNYGRKIWMILNQKNNGGNKIDVTDPYLAINKKLAEATIFIPRVINRKTEIDTAEVSSDLEKNITLTNVIVKSKSFDHPFFEAKEVHGFNTNACGDYVCARWGDLNCPLAFHDLTRTIKPIKGKIYFRVVLDTEGRPIMRFQEEYKGCSLEETNTNNIYFLPGIYEPKIFYGADYSQPGSPQTQYLSTIFWSPAILVNNGEATFSFITGDTKGKFNIVVQGLSTNDVLFGENSFLVK